MRICKTMFVGKKPCEQKRLARLIFKTAASNVCVFAASNQRARARLEMDVNIKWVYINARALSRQEGLNRLN